MRELTLSELNEVSGGFGLMSMVNDQVIRATSTIAANNVARIAISNAVAGSAMHLAYSLGAGSQSTAASLAGNAAASSTAASVGVGAAVLGAPAAAGLITAAALGGYIGGAIENRLNQRAKELEQLEFQMNGGV